MNVLLMISSIAMGGAERVLVSLLPHLRQIEGVNLMVCTLNTTRDSPLIEPFERTGVPRYDLGVPNLMDVTGWQRFLRLVREKEIDIISAQDQYTNLYGVLAHFATRIPVVMTRHVMVEPTDSRKEKILAQMTLWALRYGADQTIAVSEAVRQHLSKQARIPLSRIETIHNGIEVGRFDTKSQRAAKRREMGWPEDQPTVIMVAVLRRGKGHEVLFDVVPQLQARIPNVRIKLVGEGELGEQLRQQAAPLGEAVEFLGQRMDVPELLGASDVLVLPSWSEALPTVLIEAGAASLPVVATDVGGAAEIVAEGETGYLIPPVDAAQLAGRLIDVLTDQELAHQMGVKAKQRVDALFSLQRQAQQTTALFRRTIAAK